MPPQSDVYHMTNGYIILSEALIIMIYMYVNITQSNNGCDFLHKLANHPKILLNLLLIGHEIVAHSWTLVYGKK